MTDKDETPAPRSRQVPDRPAAHPAAPGALLARTARVLGRAVGVAAGGAKLSFLARRLAAEVDQRGADPLWELLERAEGGEAEALLALRNLVTVNYSCFWREPAHWPILTEHLRLKFVAGTAVRLWSAACASGEEAYSMAMVAADLALTLPGPPPDWRILASDIDTDSLAAAAAGRYGETALGDLPAAQRARYLSPAPDPGSPTWQVDQRLRSHCDFMRFDLARPHWDPLPGAPFDAIFLSNVLIYFAPPVQARILKHAAASLRPDGILLTSRSEGNLGLAGSTLKACGDCAYILAPTARRT